MLVSLLATYCLFEAIKAANPPQNTGEESSITRVMADLDGLSGIELLVDVIALHREFRVRLTPEIFEEYVHKGVSDYALKIRSESFITELRRLVTQTNWQDAGSADRVEVRYRLEFMRGSRSLVMFFATVGGDIVLGDRIYVNPDGAHWMRTLWHELEDDIEPRSPPTSK